MENWGAAELRALFGGSADVAERQIMAGGQKLDVLFLDGLTSGGDIAEQVLRPLMQTVQPGSMQAVLAQAEQARVYCAVAERVTAPEDAADKLLHGYCAVVFPGTGAALCFETKTDTRRGPSAPESENTVKGAKDAFTETMRINTSLLPPSALGAAALRAEDRGPSEPDGRHGLLPCGPDGSGARPAHGAAAGGDRYRRDADARERGGICDRLA